MILITGGAYQGKSRYAAEKYGFDVEDIADGETVDTDEISGYRCVKNFHTLVKRLVESGKNPVESARVLIDNDPDVVIIMNDVGGGIIPMEKSERIWREQVGITGCFLAGRAESVVRVVCGIGMEIK